MLNELEQLDGAEWVSGALFELALDQLFARQEGLTPVGRALGALMQAELRYHHRLQETMDEDALDLAGLDRIEADQRRELQARVEELRRVEASSQTTRVARELSLAEGCVRLGYLKEALAHLDRAEDLGLQDSLLCLVRGYLRYQQATRELAEAGGDTEGPDQVRFQIACLRAVSAFEQGLGGDLDAQLYWWIASVLDVAGFSHAAAEASRRAEAAEEQEEDEDVTLGTEDAYYDEDEVFEVAEPETEEPDTPKSLPEIDPTEERMVDETLRNPDALRKLLGPDAEDAGD